jgi:hypothetical protein
MPGLFDLNSGNFLKLVAEQYGAEAKIIPTIPKHTPRPNPLPYPPLRA